MVTSADLGDSAALKAVGKGAVFDVMELSVVLLVITVLLFTALNYYDTALRRAQFIETPSLATKVKDQIIEYRAVMGAWPSARYVDDHFGLGTGFGGSGYVTGGDDGSFSMVVQYWTDEFDRPLVTFRPATDPTDDMATVIWICGRGAVPSGRVANGEDLTNVPDEWLTHQCRTGGFP
jgi:Tfp pilus assembly major pilin PilA